VVSKLSGSYLVYLSDNKIERNIFPREPKCRFFDSTFLDRVEILIRLNPVVSFSPISLLSLQVQLYFFFPFSFQLHLYHFLV